MRRVNYHLYTLWLFTYSDLKTVIYPQLAFGLSNALSGLVNVDRAPSVLAVLARIPLILLWVWFVLLLEVVSNQRLPLSILEDVKNKPWRPLPSRRLSPRSAQRLLLFSVPIVLMISFFLGTVTLSMAIIIVSWMYNDLGGADHNYVVRNVLNACGSTVIGAGATTIAAGRSGLNENAAAWFGILACTIFSTVQTQDLADMEGDAARARKTMPLVHGHSITRWSIALFVTFWSFVCPSFWNLDTYAYCPPVLVGGLLASRALFIRNVGADKLTWKIWCIWMIVLYTLPLWKEHGALEACWKEIGHVKSDLSREVYDLIVD